MCSITILMNDYREDTIKCFTCDKHKNNNESMGNLAKQFGVTKSTIFNVIHK